jgi:hypothetical protein
VISKEQQNGKTKRRMRLDPYHCIRHSSRRHHYLVLLTCVSFIIAVSLYALNQFYLKHHVIASFFHSYFNDVLAGITFITYSNMLFFLVGKPQHCFQRLHTILSLIIAAGWFWEYVTPLYRKDSVSDPIDILAYAIGAACYWLLLKMPQLVQKARVNAKFFSMEMLQCK